MTSFIHQLVKQQLPRRWDLTEIQILSILNTFHRLRPTHVAAVNIKLLSLLNIVTVTVTTQLDHFYRVYCVAVTYRQ